MHGHFFWEGSSPDSPCGVLVSPQLKTPFIPIYKLLSFYSTLRQTILLWVAYYTVHYLYI